MKTMIAIAIALAISALCSVGLTQSQAQTKDEKKTNQRSDRHHHQQRIERDFVSAAEAMPEDKYSFAPTNGEFKGVRTFANRSSIMPPPTTWLRP